MQAADLCNGWVRVWVYFARVWSLRRASTVLNYFASKMTSRDINT